MRRTTLARVIAGAFACSAVGVAGAQQMKEEDAVVVTGTPFGSGLFDLVPPADRLEGRSLMFRRKSTLGETLDGIPGVSNSAFGPSVGRPVIRGLDSDRIRILQNGTGTLDASSLSFDHAVPHDPLIAESIEVLRGPAAVLYGGNAVGGVVNVIDSRIPSIPLSGVTGRFEPRFGGPDRERSLGGVLEGGNGRFALHADFFDRNTSDLRIPGFARSGRQRALDAATVEQPEGSLPNSDMKADGGALGGSVTWDSGYAGLSHSGYYSNYGSVAEREVRIDMKSDRTDLAAEARDLGSIISTVKLKLGRTDYQHREIEGGAVNTTFKNNGHDGRLELAHANFGPFKGAFGLSVSDFDFSALGAEAFVPSTSTRARGLFLYEEVQLSSWKLSVGLRNENTRVKSEGGGPADGVSGLPKFDPPESRTFSANSYAFGALYSINKQLAVAGNLSFTQRAPTFYELYANGAHVATGQFELGSRTLDKEKSRSYDIGMRWRSAAHSASFTVFRTRFDNFIALTARGDNLGADGSLEDAGNAGFTVAGDEVFPVQVYRAVPALFRGAEVQGRFRVYERAGALDLLVRGDYVKAHNEATGAPLPRIAPMRASLGLEYSLNNFTANVEAQYVWSQDRVATGELPTNNYTLVHAAIAYSMKSEPMAFQFFARLNNLFDNEARNHVSFLKDRAPLPGRGLLLGLRGSF